MSVINQMLQDLEARRASAAERSALPDHVRVLPPAGKVSARRWLLAAALAAALVGSAVTWSLTDKPSRVSPAAPPSKPAPDATAAGPAARAPTQEPTTPAPTPVATKPQQPAQATVAAATTSPHGRSVPDAAAPPPPRPESAASVPVAVANDPQRTLPSARSVLNGREESPRSEAGRGSAAVPPATAASSPELPLPLPSSRAARRDAAAARESRVAQSDGGAAKLQIEKRAQLSDATTGPEDDYRAGTELLRDGRLAEAQAKFSSALARAPHHVGARQALFGMLLSSGQKSEAEDLLNEGLALDSRQSGFAMALARLQVERGDAAAAIRTLERSAQAAAANAHYIAFLAALLQRQERHAEAVERYQTALAASPTAGVWWIGLGISLHALNRHSEAQDAMRRAKSTGSLSPDLAAFADDSLRQLQRR